MKVSELLIGRKQNLSRLLVGSLKDSDKDKIPNITDCKPFDKRFHGPIIPQQLLSQQPTQPKRALTLSETQQLKTILPTYREPTAQEKEEYIKSETEKLKEKNEAEIDSKIASWQSIYDDAIAQRKKLEEGGLSSGEKAKYYYYDDRSAEATNVIEKLKQLKGSGISSSQAALISESAGSALMQRIEQKRITIPDKAEKDSYEKYKMQVFKYGMQKGFENLSPELQKVISPQMKEFIEKNKGYKVEFKKESGGAISASLKQTTDTSQGAMNLSEPKYTWSTPKTSYGRKDIASGKVEQFNTSNNLFGGVNRQDTERQDFSLFGSITGKVISSLSEPTLNGDIKLKEGLATAPIPTGTIMGPDSRTGVSLRTSVEATEMLPSPTLVKIKEKVAGVKEKPTIDITTGTFELKKQRKEGFVGSVRGVVSSLVPTDWGGVAFNIATIGAGVGVAKFIPKIAMGLSALFTGYSATQIITSPTIKGKEEAIGQTALGLGGFAYAGYRYLRQPRLAFETQIIKRKIPSKPQIFIESEKGQLSISGKDGLGKPISLDTKNVFGVGYSVGEGRRTVVTTPLREFLGLEPVYSGSYFSDRKGYSSAIKKLVKYGLSDYQARELVRQRYPFFKRAVVSGKANVLTKDANKPLIDFAGRKVVTAERIEIMGVNTRRSNVASIIKSKGKVIETPSSDMSKSASRTLELRKIGKNKILGEFTEELSLSKNVGSKTIGGREVTKFYSRTMYRKPGARRFKVSDADVYVFGERPEIKISLDSDQPSFRFDETKSSSAFSSDKFTPSVSDTKQVLTSKQVSPNVDERIAARVSSVFKQIQRTKTKPSIKTQQPEVQLMGSKDSSFQRTNLLTDKMQVGLTGSNLFRDSFISSDKETMEEKGVDKGLFLSGLFFGDKSARTDLSEERQRQEQSSVILSSSAQTTRTEYSVPVQPVSPRIILPGENKFTPEPPRVKIPNIDLDLRKERRWVKQTPYNAYVLVEGTQGTKARYEQINKQPLTLASALSVMAKAVDNTISARGKVSISKPRVVDGKKVTAVALDTGDRYYQQNKYKFRNYKSAKKLPLPSGVLIEKQKYRLDNPQETVQIRSSLFRL